MKFSIIMPSFLGNYPGAARNRDEKILRAIDSVINQSFTDWELIVVADGCNITFDLISRVYADNHKIQCLLIDKAALFSGVPRSLGIKEAKGEYIIYLDIDDYYGENHLKTIAENLKDFDWVWYNDIRWKNKWVENPCSIITIGRSGTSNICHRKDLGEKWTAVGYAHDYHFNHQLLKHKNYTKIETPEYFVCHVPGMYDI
jgi:glycosyltransferase involved in cell wall biosynthesis